VSGPINKPFDDARFGVSINRPSEFELDDAGNFSVHKLNRAGHKNRMTWKELLTVVRANFPTAWRLTGRTGPECERGILNRPAFHRAKLWLDIGERYFVHYPGDDVQAIAEELGMTPSAVHSIVNRVRKAMEEQEL
jgi:hypothetical protein